MVPTQDRLAAAIRSIQARDPRLGRELEARRTSAAIRETAERIINESALEVPGPEQAVLVQETIVLRTGRPVLAVYRDEPKLEFRDAESEVWRERLLQAKARLIPAIRAVGRIELKNNPRYQWVGTGWLVRPDIIVTNRHVAAEFGSRGGEGFVFRLGPNGRMGASIDFLEEFGRDDTLTFELKKILHIECDSGPDVALLQVDGSDLAEPIRLAAEPAPTDLFVAVVGYPARDSRIPDQKPIEDVFGDIFDKKRLAPGQITRSDSSRLSHDCSTAGGNSGSTILNLGSGAAIGLHFAGRFLETNFAVPAALIEERLRRLECGRLRPSSRKEEPARSPDPSVRPALASAEPGMAVFDCTIPVRLRIEIGAPEPAARPAIPPVSRRIELEDEVEEEEDLLEAPPESYADRKGYDPKFLGCGREVSLPQIVRDADQIVEYSVDGEPETELRYEHFSVVMNRERRLCFYSAVNIDGAQSRKMKRTGWQWDSRIPRALQIKSECYGNEPKFSRGHMTRREDPIWGSQESARLGNSDSMHVTNSVPQMQPFNGGIWLGLEDYALENAREDDMRISVITGPIFRPEDPVRFGVRIPVEFWKVIAFIHDETDELSATGYSMSQEDFLRDEEFVFGQHKTHQRSLAWVEAQAGVSFGSLTGRDPLRDEEEALPAALTDFGQIRFV